MLSLKLKAYPKILMTCNMKNLMWLEAVVAKKNKNKKK